MFCNEGMGKNAPNRYIFFILVLFSREGTFNGMLGRFLAIHSGLPNVQNLLISSKYLSTFFCTCKKGLLLFNGLLPFFSLPFIGAAFPGKISFFGPVIPVCVKQVAFFVLWKAFFTIYRTVSAGLERDFAFFVAVCANNPSISSFPGTIALSSTVMARRVIEVPGRLLGIAFLKRPFWRLAD